MFSRTRTTLTLAVAAVCGAGSLGCTDLGVEPKSTVTEANVFNDANAYRAFLARLYTGLAVSGQQGPAGRPPARIRSITSTPRTTSSISSSKSAPPVISPTSRVTSTCPASVAW